MTGAITPGWYPDPTDAGQERWWDGTTWTRTTRPRPPVGYAPPVAGDVDATQQLPPVLAVDGGATQPPPGLAVDGAEEGRRSRRWWLVAGILLPVLAGGVVWGVLTLLPGATADPDADPLASGALVVDDQPTERETEAPPLDDVVTDPPEEDTEPAEEPQPLPRPEPQLDPEVGEPPSGSTEDDHGFGASDGDAEDGTAAGADDDTSGSADTQQEQRTVDLDGQCTVTVDADLVDGGQPIRAWDHPECQWAPIGLGPGEQQWIVVVTSLNGEAHGAASALERADEYGFPGNVLWSSHYPSLNPGVWAIYDGPYRTEDDANAATRRVGGRAYPRVLSEDPGDRYCIGADNCEGERD